MLFLASVVKITKLCVTSTASLSQSTSKKGVWALSLTGTMQIPVCYPLYCTKGMSPLHALHLDIAAQCLLLESHKFQGCFVQNIQSSFPNVAPFFDCGVHPSTKLSFVCCRLAHEQVTWTSVQSLWTEIAAEVSLLSKKQIIHHGLVYAARGLALQLPNFYWANQTTTAGTDWRSGSVSVTQTQTVSVYPEPLRDQLSPGEEKVRIHKMLDVYSRSGALFHKEYRCVSLFLRCCTAASDRHSACARCWKVLLVGSHYPGRHRATCTHALVLSTCCWTIALPCKPRLHALLHLCDGCVPA